jgi:hypothetical protein
MNISLVGAGLSHSMLDMLVRAAGTAGHTVVYIDSEAAFKPPPLPVFEFQQIHEGVKQPNQPFWKGLKRYKKGQQCRR